MSWTIEAVRSEDARQALRWTLAAPDQSRGELERQVNAFLEYCRALALDGGRHWLARLDGRVAAACTCLPSPGRTAMLFLPDGDVLRPSADDVERLVRWALDAQPDLKNHLFQCLLREQDLVNQQALRAVGFRDLAVLRYLECRIQPDQMAAPCGECNGAEWIAYRADRHDQFAAVISATFQGSLDCPGLNGLRSIEEVIAGHQAVGKFDPRRWLLLRIHGEAAGCILFGENPLRPMLELTYMGLTPQWRGRGVGRYLLRHGLALACRQGVESVTVAVDSANAAAIRLYESTGFRETARRLAMIHSPASSFGNV